MRKLLVLAAVLAASTAGLAAAMPASASPADVTPSAIAAITDSGVATVQLCDSESTRLCMAGHDGVNGPITGKPHATGVAETVNVFSPSNCGGTVTDGPNNGCPFTASSGLNVRFHGDLIIEIQNADPANAMFYRAVNDADLIESPTGDGELWVVDHNSRLVNVKASDDTGAAQDACTNGNGNQVLLTPDSIASFQPCTWVFFQ